MNSIVFSKNPAEVSEAINTVGSRVLAALLICSVLLTFGGFKATYGRYSTSKMGPAVPGIVDWYMHATALVGVIVSIAYDRFNPFTKPRAAILLAMFTIHYIQRSFLFAWQMDPSKIKPIPIVVLCMGSGFCLVNGFLNSRYLTAVCDDRSLGSVQFLFGAIIWALGFYGNIWHDRRLIQLKRESQGNYVIPTGGLFEYISGANFFCEIVEWLGYAIASNFSFPSTAFFIITASNIGPRGVHHHQYYLEKFPDYPKSRRAIIPFVL